MNNRSYGVMIEFIEKSPFQQVKGEYIQEILKNKKFLLGKIDEKKDRSEIENFCHIVNKEGMIIITGSLEHSHKGLNELIYEEHLKRTRVDAEKAKLKNLNTLSPLSITQHYRVECYYMGKKDTKVTIFEKCYLESYEEVDKSLETLFTIKFKLKSHDIKDIKVDFISINELHRKLNNEKEEESEELKLMDFN